MPYQIIVSQKAKKQIKKLDRKIIVKFDRTILDLHHNPFPRGIKILVSVGSRQYRIRIGDYRIIYTIEAKKKLIYILKVGHRKDIYR